LLTDSAALALERSGQRLERAGLGTPSDYLDEPRRLASCLRHGRCRPASGERAPHRNSTRRPRMPRLPRSIAEKRAAGVSVSASPGRLSRRVDKRARTAKVRPGPKWMPHRSSAAALELDLGSRRGWPRQPSETLVAGKAGRIKFSANRRPLVTATVSPCAPRPVRIGLLDAEGGRWPSRRSFVVTAGPGLTSIPMEETGKTAKPLAAQGIPSARQASATLRPIQARERTNYGAQN
jgi:hypothetical protein